MTGRDKKGCKGVTRRLGKTDVIRGRERFECAHERVHCRAKSAQGSRCEAQGRSKEKRERRDVTRRDVTRDMTSREVTRDVTRRDVTRRDVTRRHVTRSDVTIL